MASCANVYSTIHFYSGVTLYIFGHMDCSCGLCSVLISAYAVSCVLAREVARPFLKGMEPFKRV